MFDLEKAIATWRRAYEVNPAFSDEDLEELEGSLRDRIDALTRRMSEQEAFETAIRRIGSLGKAETEYKKVYWGKLRREHRLADEFIWRGSMLKNYLTLALRNLRKHPLYAFINVAGLAVGLACCTFITLYVLDELSYDRFHEHADRIVRVVEDQTVEGRVSRFATTYGPLAPALEDDLSAVEQAVRVFPYSLLVSRTAAQKYQEDGVVFVDSTFFEVFSFSFIRGDAHTVLDAPFSLVLTETTARKYFGDANPVGRTLRARDDEDLYDFTITGVVQDPPPATHLRFDFLASFASMRVISGGWIEDPQNWDHPPLYTYALLAERTEPDDLEAQLPAFARKHMGEWRTQTRSLHVEPLTGIRLFSGRESDLTPGSDITYVYLFALIAFFILLIACINFMNLATARAANRAKEVGLRKTLGARRGQLIHQFLAESMMLVALALGGVVVLVTLFLPVFNRFADKALAAGVLVHWTVPLAVLATVVLVGSLAGGYPAFHLSRFRPVRVLKGATTATGRPAAARFRRSLVVFQFVISIGLISGTGVVHQQLDYMQNERLGFNKEHVVLVPLRDLENQFRHEVLKGTWEQLPGVEAVTASSGMPGLGSGVYDFLVKPQKAAQDSLEMLTLTVDHDYVKTYGLEIVAGRDFSEDFSTDATEALLINESAARRLGWTDPVGRKLTLQVWLNAEIQKPGTVVGVVRDFQYHSLHRAIDPLVLHILPSSYYYDYLSVRLHPGHLPETLAALEATWTRFNPERPFEYTFLDDQFDALYRAEARLSGLFGVFTGLAVVIACLGLFGLAAFTAETRTKEIGIRKVLGASAGSIVGLLSKDFLALVGLAFVIAAPVSFVLMRNWLEHFAYRIELGPGVFLLTGGLVVLIALLTVSYQSIKAALADPVKSLRYE
jgi:putative ABC transport system permease protein